MGTLKLLGTLWTFNFHLAVFSNKFCIVNAMFFSFMLLQIASAWKLRIENIWKTKISKIYQISLEHRLSDQRLPQYESSAVVISDEPKLEFSGSSRAELWGFGAEPSQAELGHFNFRAETELTIPTICMSKNCKLAANFRSYLKIAPVTWF